jgi:hypothetical protein
MMSTSPATHERVVTIGPDENVIGIVTESAREGSEKLRPNVVFLNAGVLHRVGPHRLHVMLARRLAASGFCSLRIDLSGIGDSRNVPGALTFRESSVADARNAMDFLLQHSLIGHGSTGAFIFFGLCSGADNGLATALADERVIGLILVDPPTYATYRSRLRRIVGRLSSFGGAVGPMAAWVVGAATRQLRRWLQTSTHRITVSDPAISARPAGRPRPLQEEYFQQISTLLDRGVKILCIFSGANGAGYNHPDQLYESFPRLQGRLDVAYLPAANHVFTEPDARNALKDAVTQWCCQNFG